MLLNKNFYPTPPNLINKMIWKIKGNPSKILEPSAGKGDIIEAMQANYKYKQADYSAIESDITLQATLRGKDIKVIDTDFLAYAGPDKFDAIVMNPPFDTGDQHLLKAIEILYRGEIVCLLNAETLRNPHTNNRKLLVRKLDELGASIEYIQNGFVTAERRTGVEVALIHIKVDRNIEDDLFAGADDHAARSTATVEDKHEVSTGKTVEELVAEYNDIIHIGTETIVGFYRNSRKAGKYLSLSVGSDKNEGSKDLTGTMQHQLNYLLKNVRTDFWRRTLDLKEVANRLTQKRRHEFEAGLSKNCFMDFTESNIRQFVLNLMGGYEQTLTDAVLDIFDMFTIRHCWDDNNRHEKNIHYFNGWKTNSAFKVGRRVVVPVRGSYGGPFTGYSGWSLDYQAAQQLTDIDLVMSYFDGMADHVGLPDAICSAFSSGENSGQSSYFKFICHKKGTIHLTFLNDDILRRFNVVACRGKGWIPGDFGAKSYRELSAPERAVVDSFEGEKSYDANRTVALFGGSNLPQIELFQEAA